MRHTVLRLRPTADVEAERAFERVRGQELDDLLHRALVKLHERRCSDRVFIMGEDVGLAAPGRCGLSWSSVTGG
jgi:hypothetical protein